MKRFVMKTFRSIFLFTSVVVLLFGLHTAFVSANQSNYCSILCRNYQGACADTGWPTCYVTCEGQLRLLEGGCAQYVASEYDPTGYCCQECPC